MDNARIIEEILREKAGLPSRSSEEPEEVSIYSEETPILVQTMPLTMKNLTEAADMVNQSGFRSGTYIMAPLTFRELMTERRTIYTETNTAKQYSWLSTSPNIHPLSSAQLDWNDQSY